MTQSLKPWYAIATPHEDIRAGRFSEAIFAANLWKVVEGRPPDVYRDPQEFFSKSYMTVGLGTVLTRVATALRGEDAGGSRIIGLQTSFGGGKTHTLVALWHLAKHASKLSTSPAAEELRRVLGDRFPKDVKGVAVFTNETCDATQGRKTPEGVHTHTLWGEIALQLGGPDLYEQIRPNDETQRVPQGLFADLLRKASPCLILIDELADYCVGAAAVPVGDTTLADQTISFVQQLTQAVDQVPGAVVVATLPASKLEVAQSEKGQEAFVVLEKRFQRLGMDIKPVADDEIYEVVRRRLFESITPPDEPDYPRQVAAAYHAMYSAHSGEVPAEATKNSYRDQIERAYPFHPSVIDALYTRWGSHPDFQRTRGVLRLLASIVGDLWEHRNAGTETQHLIQPCHICWTLDPVQAALTRLWGMAYQSVVAADVNGGKANAVVFDDERGGDYRREGIGRGLAAAILFGSFGGQGERTGFSGKEIKLACNRQGVNWNYVDGALLELEGRCFYLHSAAAGNMGKRYWFGTKPTLNKLIVQYRQQYSGEGFDQAILDILDTQTTKATTPAVTWKPIVDPQVDLPEQKGLALLILPPTLSWGDDSTGGETAARQVVALSTRCGNRDRTYRNTLLFLAGTPRGLSKLRQAHREMAALKGVMSDYGSQLDEDQRADLKGRIAAAEQDALKALSAAYTVVLRVRGKDEIEACTLSDARPVFLDHLGYAWNTLVEDEEWILRTVGSVTLQESGLVPTEGGQRVKDAVEAFLRFTDKPIIATREAVTKGLAQACKDGLVGIGRGVNTGNLQARYCKVPITLDPTEDGLWIIPAFEPEAKKDPTAGEKETVRTTTNAKTGTGTAAGHQATGGTGTGAGSTGGTVRRIVIRGVVPVESWYELFRSFIQPAVRMNSKVLRLGIDFEIELAEEQGLDANDQMLKAMKEAARQLGLDFEAM